MRNLHRWTDPGIINSLSFESEYRFVLEARTPEGLVCYAHCKSVSSAVRLARRYYKNDKHFKELQVYDKYLDAVVRESVQRG